MCDKKDIVDFVKKIVNATRIEDARLIAIDFLTSGTVARKGKQIQAYVAGQNYGAHFFLTEEEYGNIQYLLSDNQKINAIKQLRGITNWGLKAALDAVENPENFKQYPVKTNW